MPARTPPPGRARGTRSRTGLPSRLAFADLLRRIGASFGWRILGTGERASQYTRSGVSRFDRGSRYAPRMTPSHLKRGGAIWAGLLVLGVGLGLGPRLFRPVRAVVAAQTRGAVQAPTVRGRPLLAQAATESLEPRRRGRRLGRRTGPHLDDSSREQPGHAQGPGNEAALQRDVLRDGAGGAGVRPGGQPAPALGTRTERSVDGPGARHPHRPQEQRVAGRRRWRRCPDPEVHDGRQVRDAGREERRTPSSRGRPPDQRSQQPGHGELRTADEDRRRSEDQRGLCVRRLRQSPRRRAGCRYRQVQTRVGRVRQQTGRYAGAGPAEPAPRQGERRAACRQGRGSRSERAAAAAVPQPRALRRHLQGRPGVCLRPAGRSPAGVHEGREVREGKAHPAEHHERRLRLGRGAVERSSADVPVRRRRRELAHPHPAAGYARHPDGVRRGRPPAGPVARRAQHRDRFAGQHLYDRDLRRKAHPEVHLSRA